MSAICGIFGRAAMKSGPALQPMMFAMASRGPDGEAAHIDDARSVALGVRHLAVSEVDAGACVFSNEDATLFMVCDGQVFNSAELSESLAQKGHRLRGEHSAEVLLHLFEEQGIDGFRRVDGQFALAIWDGRRNELLLARDFLGVRSLYYHARPEGIFFASEIKALLRHPLVPRAVDDIAVSHYLTFLNAPGPRTLFAGISKLPPGTAAICKPDGNVALHRYWSLLDAPIDESDDLTSYVDRVRSLHGSAVKRRATPGPIAALLSGGNDSSANVAYLAQFKSAPLHTVTVGLADVEGQQKYNDLEYARKVADLVGSQHHELLLSTDEFLNSIPRTVGAMDDMVSEPSSIFLYHALRVARESGARVVITGEANDELCCGHGEMIRIRDSYYRRWQPMMNRPRWVRQLASAVLSRLSPKRRDVLARAAAGDEYFWNFEIGWMESEKSEIVSPSLLDRTRRESPAAVVAQYAKQLRASAHGQRDYLNYMIYVMMQDYYFGNLMLGKLDLLAADVGIEARCPYTDPSYAHLVYNVPAKFKFRDGMVKYFFRKAIEGLLPDSIIYRPKQGFRTPVVELFKGKLGDWARPVLLDGGLTRAGYLKRDTLENLLVRHRAGERDFSNRLWTAMTLNLWHERWINSTLEPVNGPAPSSEGAYRGARAVETERSA